MKQTILLAIFLTLLVALSKASSSSQHPTSSRRPPIQSSSKRPLVHSSSTHRYQRSTTIDYCRTIRCYSSTNSLWSTHSHSICCPNYDDKCYITKNEQGRFSQGCADRYEQDYLCQSYGNIKKSCCRYRLCNGAAKTIINTPLNILLISVSMMITFRLFD